MSRFVVREVRGFLGDTIRGKSAHLPTSFVVLDSAVMYRFMAEFPPPKQGGDTAVRRVLRRERAEAFAASLERKCAEIEAGRQAA